MGIPGHFLLSAKPFVRHGQKRGFIREFISKEHPRGEAD
jgi:hypothetical protein